MQANRISFGSETTRERPIRLANAERADTGGFWRATHVSGEKWTGWEAWKTASLGGNWRREDAGVDAICLAFEAIRSACAMDEEKPGGRRRRRERERRRHGTLTLPISFAEGIGVIPYHLWRLAQSKGFPAIERHRHALKVIFVFVQ